SGADLLLHSFPTRRSSDLAGGLELLDDLLVGDPRIFLDLVEVEQFLPRRGQVLVGGEDRHQRAERQTVLDDQIPAQRVEEERRQDRKSTRLNSSHLGISYA